MVVDWTLLACFVTGLFIITGFFRGWWKEALTTALLGGLVFLLQSPDLANQVINFINRIISRIWNIIPNSLNQFVVDVTENFFNFVPNLPPQLDASSGLTWFLIMIGVLVVGALIGRFGFKNEATAFGKLMGAGLGGVNGFLVLSLIREYMDGRALPGGREVAATPGITVVSSSSFAPPATSVSIEVAGLPSTTILDSVIPWMVVGVSALLLFAILRTRVSLDTDKEGGKKIKTKVPPFYRVPPPPKKPKSADEVIEKLFR